MLLGALGGILYYEQKGWFIKLFANKMVQILSWLCILLICLNRFHIISFLDNEIISVAALALIVGQITERNRVINLENRFCDFLGRISFGIYIIHGMIMLLTEAIFTRLELPYTLKFILVFPAVAGLTVLAAYLSYQYFEKPFLRIKGRFEVVKTKPVLPEAIPVTLNAD
jgi:peptidoglycan/LPS O-acetylase OafA/YrhL